MERRKRVMVIDAEASSRELLALYLLEFGYDVDTAADSAKALEKLDASHDLVLLGVMRANMDGCEIVRRIRGRSLALDIPICMVTALSSQEERLRAVEAGANEFITMPVDKTELKVRSASLLKAKEAQDLAKRYKIELEAGTEVRTADLLRALEETKLAHEKTSKAHLETIERLAIAAEYRDSDSVYHIRRMSHYCLLIAQRLQLTAQECKIIRYASTIHDIGKISVPDRILFKAGKLSTDDWVIMKRHPTVGAHILGASSSEFLQAGEVFALTHHEKWDGSGYPQGLAGIEIPLWGRIAAIADVFDGLTGRRPYKEPFSNSEALLIMEKERGRHFDPKLLDLFYDSFEDVQIIQRKYRDPVINTCITTQDCVPEKAYLITA